MSRLRLLASCSLVIGGWLAAPVLHAQFSDVTDEDIKSVPEAFRSAARTGPNFAGFAARGTPAGYRPNSNMHDFSGSYVSGGGGGGGPPGGGSRGAPPGGAGGPPGGGAPGGGGPQGVSAGGVGSTCLPSFGGGAYPTHIVSSPTELTVVGEENHRIRRIRIADKHALPGTASFSGDSIARWDGNTLVVETTGIIGRSGTFLERWSKQADGSLQVISTTLAADGGSVDAEQTAHYTWRPDLQFLENICEDFGEAFTKGYGGK
jgi:hypothetical protein